MNGAVFSMLLMAGACGAPDGVDGVSQHRAVVIVCENDARAPEAVSRWAPQTPDGTVYYRQGCLGLPWYSQVWRMHERMTFYPADYAKPYDYREIFNYPWNGPRPPMPPQWQAQQGCPPMRSGGFQPPSAAQSP